MSYILASRIAARRLLGFPIYRPMFVAGSRAKAQKGAAAEEAEKPVCVQQIIPRAGESYDAKNYRLGRPLAPSWTIYKPQIGSAMSIANRIAGVVTSCYLISLATFALIQPYDFCQLADYIDCVGLPQFLIYFFRFCIAFPFVYHGCNGIRYLVWTTGKFLDRVKAPQSGLVVLGVTAVTTILVVFVL